MALNCFQRLIGRSIGKAVNAMRVPCGIAWRDGLLASNGLSASNGSLTKDQLILPLNDLKQLGCKP